MSLLATNRGHTMRVIFRHRTRAFRSVVDRLLCMLKVKGSNPLMSMLFFSELFYLPSRRKQLHGEDKQCGAFTQQVTARNGHVS
jgi:hypothetical protein